MVLVAAVAVASGLGACGNTTHNRHADNEGIYVDVNGLKYQVQLSRQLNTYSAEDSAYVDGLSAAQQKLTPQQAWFGVFVLVLNTTGRSHAAATTYFITDTQGTIYQPTSLPSTNPFAYRAATIAPHEQIPVRDSVADTSPTNGALLLFRIPITAYDNRPLVFHILDPTDPRSDSKAATVELDV